MAGWIDRIHEEMRYRSSQARQIAMVLIRDNTRQLSRQVDFRTEGGMPVITVNPLNWERNEVTIAELDFDFQDPAADSFRLLDHNGTPVPHQVLGSEDVTWMETLKPNRKKRVRTAMRVSVPSCGYAAVFGEAVFKSEGLPYFLSTNVKIVGPAEKAVSTGGGN